MRVEDLDLRQQVEAAAIWKHEIEEHDVDLFFAEHAHSVGGRHGPVTIEAIALEEGPEHILEDGLVVNYED